MLVLQPFLQFDLGIMMFKPGKTLLNELTKMSKGNRLLLMPLPDELVNVPSGKLNYPVFQSGSKTLADKVSLIEFFTHSEVRKRLGNFQSWVEKIPHCQLSDGEYCDHNLTIMKCGRGALRVCWHHDNELRDNADDRCIELAEKNLMLFSLERIHRQLRLERDRVVSLQELCWWSVINGVYDALPKSIADEVLGVKQKHDQGKLNPRRLESDDRLKPDSKESISRLAKAVILNIDEEPPALYMAKPKEITWHNEKYLGFVRTLPCVITGKTEGVVAHHLIGHGEGKTGGKAHDLFTIPLHADEHRVFHDDPKGWEEKHGSQLFYVKQTISKALQMGALI